ncbi:MAG TPA: hypothetical protein DF774_08005, partial [Rheinheimera sp.]|uniref:hypothetical protein n=1 Tax=Rheinheimera sp. TaxID=1869214 RepID=UPI000EC92AF2
ISYLIGITPVGAFFICVTTDWLSRNSATKLITVLCYGTVDDEPFFTVVIHHAELAAGGR